MLRSRKGLGIIFILLGLTIILAILALGMGQYKVPWGSVLLVLKEALFTNGDGNVSSEQAVVWFVRLPRVIIALLVGAALAMSGAVMQGILSNPLADPGIVGISSGASLGAVIAISLGLNTGNMFALPACAFVGSISAVCLTLFLAMRKGKIPVMTLLLAGVSVGMFLSAVTAGCLTAMNEQQTQQYLFWMVGGLDFRRWEHVYLALGPISLGIMLMLLAAKHLNVLVLGETEARSVGMDVGIWRIGLLGLASLTTAASVCVSGNIGFVGLVIPHMLRILVGADHRLLLPASALGGAFFLLFCDTLGRTILQPTEIRVGIMTAVLGTPYFLYLLRKMAK